MGLGMRNGQEIKVGRLVKVMTDESRVEMLTRADGLQRLKADERVQSEAAAPASEMARRFLVSVFYPVEEAFVPEREGKLLDLFAPAEEEALAVFQRMGADEQRVRGLSGPVYDGAPMERSEQARPVVVYSPAMGVDRDLYTATVTELVQAGYVVVTVGPTYETLFTVWPDGEVLRQGDAFEEFDFADLDALRALVEIRRRDLMLVLDQLAVWNAEDERLQGQLDVSRIGVIGHSLGGASVYAIAEEDSRVRAAVLQDPSLHLPAFERELEVPLLLLRQDLLTVEEMIAKGWQESVAHAYAAGERKLYERLRGYKSFVKIEKAEHMTFCDFPVMFGSGETDEALARMRALIAEATVSFLDEFVGGKEGVYWAFEGRRDAGFALMELAN